MKRCKYYFSIILSVILAAAAVGCKPNADGVDGTGARLKVGVCIYRSDDGFIQSVKKTIESSAKSANIELTVNDSRFDQELQNSQIDAMIDKGVNALAINLVDITAADVVIDKARAAGIPIVFFNREPSTDIIRSYDLACYVGTNPEEAGRLQGQLILDIWNKGEWTKNGDDRMQYVMIVADEVNPEAIARTKYSIDTVTEGGLGVENLGTIVCNWSYDEAYKAMVDWRSLRGYDRIEFVIANNDAMAAGAIAALKDAGFNKGDGGNYIPVVGIDATDEAIALINKGSMSGTVKQDAASMGVAVLKLASNAAAGNDFLTGTAYKFDAGNAVRMSYEIFKGTK